jgi:hypothetical protein
MFSLLLKTGKFSWNTGILGNDFQNPFGTEGVKGTFVFI